jgi:hypothetical protein
MKKNIEIVNLEKRIGKTQMFATIGDQPKAASEKFLANANLYLWNNGTNQNSNVNVEANEKDIFPSEDQFVVADFRALSQIHLVNRGLDFSVPGVLEAAVPLLQGKTVYPNHEYRDINNALGSVALSSWDAKGEMSGGIPGINAQIKIDALCNFKIARGLMMNPPSINSASLTILFEFEYSHPELEKEGRFWNLLGEELENSIVRLIVTNVIEIWEMSLVFTGEDRLARIHSAEIGGEDDGEDDSTDQTETQNFTASGAIKNMKLTAEQKTSLGITAEGDEVSESAVLDAALKIAETKSTLSPKEILELNEKATTGEKLLAAKREDVIKQATLHELGSSEGELSVITKKVIESASVEELLELEADFGKKLAAKFGNGRSSKENAEAVETAGGIQKNTQVKETNLL